MLRFILELNWNTRVWGVISDEDKHIYLIRLRLSNLLQVGYFQIKLTVLGVIISAAVASTPFLDDLLMIAALVRNEILQRANR